MSKATTFEPTQRYCLALEVTGARSFRVGKDGVVSISRDGEVVTVELEPGSQTAQLVGTRLVFSPVGVTAEDATDEYTTDAMLDGHVNPKCLNTTPVRPALPPEVAELMPEKPKVDAFGPLHPDPPPAAVVPAPPWVAPEPSGGRKPGRR